MLADEAGISDSSIQMLGQWKSVHTRYAFVHQERNWQSFPVNPLSRISHLSGF